MSEREIFNNPFSSGICSSQVDITLKYKEISQLEQLIEEMVENSGISYYRLEDTDEIEIEPEEKWLLTIYLDSEHNREKIASYVSELARSHNIDIIAVNASKIEDKDWAAENQKSFKPIEVEDFLIYSSYNPPEKLTKRHNIEINASRAFGTGEHQTTKAVLSLLYESRSSFKSGKEIKILDLGTGTGILAIAARKLFPASTIYATDIDKEAVNIARENYYHNCSVNISETYFYVGDGPYIEDLQDKKFDIILANILAPPLQRFAPAISEMLTGSGVAILSGFTTKQYERLLNTYLSNGLKLEARKNIDEWQSISIVNSV